MCLCDRECLCRVWRPADLSTQPRVTLVLCPHRRRLRDAASHEQGGRDTPLQEADRAVALPGVRLLRLLSGTRVHRGQFTQATVWADSQTAQTGGNKAHESRVSHGQL